jgi:curved DNA-binding protein CbpA
MMDWYAVLGVAVSAAPKEIKAAYRRLALENHPDRNPGDRTKEDRFKQVAAAYGVLGDPRERAKYDKDRIAGVVDAAPSSSTARTDNPHPRPPRSAAPPSPFGTSSSSAQRVPRSTSGPRPAAQATDGTGVATAWIGIFLGGVALFAHLAEGGGTEWDPNVQRHRDSSGRFRRS